MCVCVCVYEYFASSYCFLSISRASAAILLTMRYASLINSARCSVNWIVGATGVYF